MIREFFAAHASLMADLGGVLGVFAAIIFLAGVLIALFDRVPLEDAIYFAFITAFTVGFGDVTPKTRGARVVSVILAFLGLILVGVFVAIAAHALTAVLSTKL